MPITLDQIKEKYKNIAPVPIIEIANELGIDIFETNGLADNQSGLIKKEDGKFIIYVNESHAPVRKRFTIAHEISHFFKHNDQINDTDDHITNIKQPLFRKEARSTGKERKREAEANQIAADILMPKDNFITIWQNSNTIEEVAEKFNVSTNAAAIRANVLLGEMII